MRPGENFVAASKLYGGSINQFGHAFKNFGWEVRWADTNDVSTLRKPDRRQDARPSSSRAWPIRAATFVDIESDRQHRPQAWPAADRRQHAGHALSGAADRARRRHRRPFADQVHRRPRQFDRRRDRRRRHLRLVEVRQLPDAVGAASRIWRRRAARDLRQLRLRDCRARARPARHRSGDLALQRLPDPDRPRNPAAAHAAPLRQRADRRRLAVEPSEGRLGLLSRPARATRTTRCRRNTRRSAPARCSPSA